MDLVWHYTCGTNIQSIISDGFIKQATARIDPGEKPVVWFSSNPLWEPTASKAYMLPGRGLYRLTKKQTEKEGAGLFRFGVAKESAPYNWDDYIKLSGALSSTITRMKKNGYNQGARISQWFFTFDVVTKDKWITFEKVENDNWVIKNADDFIKTFEVPPRSNHILDPD